MEQVGDDNTTCSEVCSRDIERNIVKVSCNESKVEVCAMGAFPFEGNHQQVRDGKRRALQYANKQSYNCSPSGNGNSGNGESEVLARAVVLRGKVITEGRAGRLRRTQQ